MKQRNDIGDLHQLARPRRATVRGYRDVGAARPNSGQPIPQFCSVGAGVSQVAMGGRIIRAA